MRTVALDLSIPSTHAKVSRRPKKIARGIRFVVASLLLSGSSPTPTPPSSTPLQTLKTLCGLKSGDAVVLQVERSGLLNFLAFRYEE